MEIRIEKLDQNDLKKRGVFNWPTWEKEASTFNWHYNDAEECYFLEGDVVIVTKDNKRVKLGKGDFVTFPKGLSCVWDIKAPVRKHYNFK